MDTGNYISLHVIVMTHRAVVVVVNVVFSYHKHKCRTPYIVCCAWTKGRL